MMRSPIEAFETDVGADDFFVGGGYSPSSDPAALAHSVRIG